MATVIFNEALGKTRALAQNVEDNNPTGCLLRLHAWVITATDETLRDVGGGANISDIEALVNVAEASNTGYINIPLDAADITITVDDINDRVDIDITPQTFSAVDPGDNWSDVSLSYDPDGNDIDTVSEGLMIMDCVVSPNGGDIIVEFP